MFDQFLLFPAAAEASLTDRSSTTTVMTEWSEMTGVSTTAAAAGVVRDDRCMTQLKQEYHAQLQQELTYGQLRCDGFIWQDELVQ